MDVWGGSGMEEDAIYTSGRMILTLVSPSIPFSDGGLRAEGERLCC